jgi:hypothetical protein
MAEALKISMLDKDEHLVQRIARFRGNPETRTTVEFEIHFADGSTVWQIWNASLAETEAYETFCRTDPMLHPLLSSSADAKRASTVLNKTPISLVKPGDPVYVNLRYYSHTWYKEVVPFPDKYDVAYLVPCKYGKLSHKGCKIELLDTIFDNRFVVDHKFVRSYGWCTSLATYSSPYTLVDRAFYVAHPEIHTTRSNTNQLLALQSPPHTPMYLLQRML